MLIVMLLCGNTKGDKLMKTDYVFGDRVKVLPKLDETTRYSEVLMYEEIEFLGSNIEDD